MSPELYKRWRLGLGFVTAKNLAEHLDMAAISISTYESRGSGSSADDKLLRILEKKIIERSDDFINAVVETAAKFGMLSNNYQATGNTASDQNTADDKCEDTQSQERSGDGIRGGSFTCDDNGGNKNRCNGGGH